MELPQSQAGSGGEPPDGEQPAPPTTVNKVKKPPVCQVCGVDLAARRVFFRVSAPPTCPPKEHAGSLFSALTRTEEKASPLLSREAQPRGAAGAAGSTPAMVPPPSSRHTCPPHN